MGRKPRVARARQGARRVHQRRHQQRRDHRHGRLQQVGAAGHDRGRDDARLSRQHRRPDARHAAARQTRSRRVRRRVPLRGSRLPGR